MTVPITNPKREIREREAALSAIHRTLDRAVAGRGKALFLIGEAGLGKTTLLEHAGLMARGMKVISAHGEPMESSIPFGFIGQVSEEVSAQEAAVDPSVPYLRMLRSIQCESRHPLLLLLDDLHWADHDSQQMVLFLANRLRTMPVAMIATLRPWPPEPAEMLRGLDPGHATIERVSPLGRQSVAGMLGESLGRTPDEEVVEFGWRLGGGNPLMTEQVGFAIRDLESLPEVLDVDEPTSGFLLGRFADLDETARKLAATASAAGVRFRTEIVAEAAGLDQEQSDSGFEALFRAGLIDADGPGWLRFVHPLLGQVLYDDLSPHERDRLHATLFRVLAGRGIEAEAAEHAMVAGLEGDQQAARILERVGRMAMTRGAVASGAHHLLAALELRGRKAGPEMRLETMAALLAANRPATAEEIGEDLLAEKGLAPEMRADGLRMMARSAYLEGSSDRGERLMSESVELSAAIDPARAVRPLLDQTSITWIAEGPRAALEIASRAVELAKGDPVLFDSAMALWGHLSIETGDPAGFRSLEHYDRRLDRDEMSPLLNPTELAWAPAAIYGFSHTLKYAERFDDSSEAMRLAQRELKAAGAAEGMVTVSLFLGNHLVRQGRLRDGLAEVVRGEEFVELNPFALPFVPLIQAEASVWMGRFDDARRHLSAAGLAAGEDPGWLFRLWSGHVLGLLQLWSGDLESSDTYMEVERVADQVGLIEISSQPWESDAVRAHLRAGRRKEAERLTSLIEVRAERIGTTWPRSAALMARGALAADQGDPQAGVLFEEAAETIRGTDMPLRRAETLLAFGSWLRRNGRMVESREPLARAIATAERWEGGYLASRAVEELHLAGGRRRRSAASRNELTPAELRVARAAAEGWTNPEISARLHISVNTVRSHLKRIFTKLGIDSRRKLANRLDDPG